MNFQNSFFVKSIFILSTIREQRLERRSLIVVGTLYAIIGTCRLNGEWVLLSGKTEKESWTGQFDPGRRSSECPIVTPPWFFEWSFFMDRETSSTSGPFLSVERQSPSGPMYELSAGCHTSPWLRWKSFGRKIFSSFLYSILYIFQLF